MQTTKQTQNDLDMALKKAGAFFAFSDGQFDEQKKEGVKYVNLGSGLVVPKENAREIIKNIEKIYQNEIKKDIENNGLNNIILRELKNNECYYTGDITNAVDALEAYGVTFDDVDMVFKNKIR